jgi:biotin transport system substrate-specific component
VRDIFLVLAGTGLLALSAKINVPLPYVPMTMQSLVVLLIGATYGWRLGVATLAAYLAEGAVGLPVFAGSIGGLTYMAGPTAGYLIGFVVTALLMGLLSERDWNKSIIRSSVAMLACHAVMLAFGFAWLAGGLHIGADKAWLVGVVPFLGGSVVKSVLGAVLLTALHHRAIHFRR